ncbi:beta-1,3-glucan-binding protein-like [Diabrotica virgifera virgifera]|nr:beta-1,3-glucan-binding protein-like [Diabrotica virgifera virgifera]
MKVLLVFVLAAVCKVNSYCVRSVTTASGPFAPKNICSGDLIFEDNFDCLNLDKWKHEDTLAGGGNNEFEWYTNSRNNSYTSNGILHIKPTFVADELGEQFLQSATVDLGNKCTNPHNSGCKRTGSPGEILNPVKSARLRTLDTFSFIYGKVEVRAKVPTGDWLWPAIWLLPNKWIENGDWISSGEIDIMETRGNKELIKPNGQNIGTPLLSTTLHWGANAQTNQYAQTHYETTIPEGFDQAYHKYQVEWTPDFIKFSLDDREIGRVTPPSGGFWELGNFEHTGLPNPWRGKSKMAPFDAEFHLILNLAVGGNFFPDEADNRSGRKPWSHNVPYRIGMTDFWRNRQQWIPTWNLGTDDSHLKVDYVRVWAI